MTATRQKDIFRKKILLQKDTFSQFFASSHMEDTFHNSDKCLQKLATLTLRGI